jgi:hypothetical protein
LVLLPQLAVDMVLHQTELQGMVALVAVLVEKLALLEPQELALLGKVLLAVLTELQTSMALVAVVVLVL